MAKICDPSGVIHFSAYAFIHQAEAFSANTEDYTLRATCNLVGFNGPGEFVENETAVTCLECLDRGEVNFRGQNTRF